MFSLTKSAVPFLLIWEIEAPSDLVSKYRKLLKQDFIMICEDTVDFTVDAGEFDPDILEKARDENFHERKDLCEAIGMAGHSSGLLAKPLARLKGVAEEAELSPSER